ncbi:MAG: inositol-3-phosphate synthase [Myxococcota bacterium]
MSQKLGICLIGASGAVSTTVMAGVALMRKNLAPRQGMMSETVGLDVTALDDLRFGGWDLREDTAYEAALSHEVLPAHLLNLVRDDLSSFKPWKAAVSKRFLHSMSGKNILACSSFREEIAQMKKDMAVFKTGQGLERLVMVNLTSTEKFCEVTDVHRTLAAFEAGLDANDERISPAMKYLYAAIDSGVPYVNFTPSLSNIPALQEMSIKNGVPLAGEDGKTGQTLLKTALAPMFAVRNLKVDGWYSANILGNNDGLVLNDPESNKTKVTSKMSVLDSILGYPVEDHQVHIHYYKPRGDAKESWDNIDISGFLGEKMQIKVNFLCKDSILAAPLVLDLVRFIDLAKRQGRSGVQEQLSLFFKAPYQMPGRPVEHNLFKQDESLQAWLKA